MTYTLFSGCSLTAGSGFPKERDEPALWVNLLHSHLFPHTIKLNVGFGGRSNAGIFQDTVKGLLTHQVEYAIVQWTSTARYNLELGLELYNTSQHFIPNSPCRDHNLHNIKYTAQYLNSVRDRFTSLVHDSYEIINLLEYANSITKLAEKTNTRVFFINGVCPWDQHFFDRKTNVLPDQYTKYTQQLLNTETRDDDEIFKLYNKMHNQFDAVGGVNESNWLNLYNSMLDNRIDFNEDNSHPGVDSNRRYFEIFSNSLHNTLNL